MRTAFISTILNFPWGGADTLWTKAAEAAKARGDRLFISVSPSVARNSRVSSLIGRGDFLHLREPPSPPPIGLQARVLAKVRRTVLPARNDFIQRLADFCPDLIIISLGGTYDLNMHLDWTEWFRSSGSRVRFIANWQLENPSLSKSEWQAAKSNFKLAERVFFVSEQNLASTRRHLLEHLPHARVVHNPLRWQQSDRPPWPSPTPYRLATVSRLDEGKGIHLLLHALAQSSDLPDWELYIYGQGPAEDYVRQTANFLRLESRVRFRGYVSSLREIWANVHLMVSPAIEDGVPMTIPEAMLCGRPVLATAVGGARDWILDSTTGFICPAPTVTLLAQNLERAFKHRDRWQEMGRSAANSVQQRYRPDDYLQIIS